MLIYPLKHVFINLLLLSLILSSGVVSKALAFSDCERAINLITKAQYVSPEQAVVFHEQAIDLCPGYIRPYELAGNYYRKKDDINKAVQFFKSAAELGSNNNKLYYLLADLMLKQGQVNEASYYIEKSIELRKNYPKALSLKNKILKMSDDHGPEIIIFEPADRRGVVGIVLEHESITVRGMVSDKSGLARFSINELEVEVDEKDFFLKDIVLKDGKNLITIEAQDNIGNKTELVLKVDHKKPLREVKKALDQKVELSQLYTNSYAVLIGIDKYEKWPPLEFAVADTKAIREIFERSGFENIITVQDHEATQRRLLTILGHELPKVMKRNDRLVIYFAGHGQTEEQASGKKKGYIIPVDADPNNYFATAISMETLRGLTARIPAKHILYIMDSCYSGLGLSRSAGISSNTDEYIKKMTSRRAVQIITAGGKDEQVEERDGHGLFTTYLLQGLEGEADSNKDRIITATELGAFLRPKVSNASDMRQTPLYGRIEGEGEFLFLKTN
jgi:tetratricopeptide (TPR) repeat protein